MKLQSVRFEDETNIKYDFSLETSGKTRFDYTLIARFIGTYADGSSGRPDAAFILGMTRAALDVWHPGSLVLDLSELKYDWGDEMDWLLPPESHRPTAVIVGPACEKAIATLMFGRDSTRLATEADFIFSNLNEALVYLRKDRKRQKRVSSGNESRDDSEVERMLQVIAKQSAAAISYCAPHTVESFVQDELTQNAVAWTIDVVGSVIAKLPIGAGLHAKFDQCYELIRLRYHLLEHYNEVEPDLLFTTVTESFPALLAAVREIQAKTTAEIP